MRRLSARSLVWFALTATLVVSISCGGSDSGGTGPTPDPVVVTVTPARDTLTVSTTSAFSATVTGTSNTGVSWSVQEGAPGGSVSASGLFTASATPGTRHVIAASEESASGKDTAVVLVVAAPVAAITAPAVVGAGAAGLGASVPTQSGATYAWTITGGNITSGATTATVTFSAGAIGTLTLQCAVTNLAGTSASSSKAIAVQSIPAIASWTSSKSIVTNGQSVTLRAVFSGGTGTVNLGVGAITSGVPVVVQPVNGVQTYTLTVAGPLGPNATSNTTVEGVQAPVVYRFAAVQRVVAVGDPALLVADFARFAPDLNDVSGSVDQGVGSIESGLLRASNPLAANTTFTLTVRNRADSTVTAARAVQVEPPLPGTFSAAGSMGVTRYGFTATLLSNGKVLFTGGDNQFGVLSTALLYEPNTQLFTATGSMGEARIGHAAIRLATGQVLVTGGESASAELYDPATETFSPTGDMTTTRQGHTMTLLANGTVLVVGGDGFPVSGGTAELYDPVSGTFAATGSLNSGRTGFQAVGLADGRVLILLGVDDFDQGLVSAEAYNPASGVFSPVGTMTAAHTAGTAVRIQSGKVLVAGGMGGPLDTLTANMGLNPVAELFDPASDQFTPSGSLAFPRRNHTVVLRPDGKVLIAFGAHPWGNSAVFEVMRSELFDPSSGEFHPSGTVIEARTSLPAPGLALPSGAILYFGGDGLSMTAERFE